MTGEQKTWVWSFALLVAGVLFIVLASVWYYHEKDQRQAARGKANVDVVCTVKTPASGRAS